MLHIATTLRPSRIHGLGLFAERIISYGELIWTFNPVVDQRIPLSSLVDLDLRAKEMLMARCYINPSNPDFIVMCMDNAQFMNFQDHPNTRIGCPIVNGEASLIANRTIYEGDEITVPFESDADADRKMSHSFRSNVQIRREVAA